MRGAAFYADNPTLMACTCLGDIAPFMAVVTLCEHQHYASSSWLFIDLRIVVWEALMILDLDTKKRASL